VLLDGVGIFADALAGFYRQQLALIILFVERSVLVKSFVALQPVSSASCTAASALPTSVADARLAFKT
jgi:hypothetical protein